MRNRKGFMYSQVARWTKEFKNLFTEVSKVFIPINYTNFHWALCVVFVQEKHIVYLDSMGNGDSKNVLNAILLFLDVYAKEKGIPKFDANQWKTSIIKSPQQTNNYDCGMFMLTNMSFLLDNLKLNYSQKNMPELRYSVAEMILDKGFNYSMQTLPNNLSQYELREIQHDIHSVRHGEPEGQARVIDTLDLVTPP